MTTLSGITWNHTRGFVPLVAASQRFVEHAGVEVVWQKRSLQEFADFPLQVLAERFDLLVIDHPFVGYAAARHSEGKPVLLPLDELLPQEFLQDQAEYSVGASHRSYEFNRHQWALAIDAATPVSSWRPDVLERHGMQVPETWEELLDLAESGLVAVPAIPIDSLMNFFMLCVAEGEDPCLGKQRVVSEEVGAAALQNLRELVRRCAPGCLERNPIATYEFMADGSTENATAAYCPFAYGYSNYARQSYAPNLLQFGGLVTFNGARLRSTLGGTGLAISSRCEHVREAAAFAEFVAGSECQRTIYTHSGGQPGHRAAWEDEEANQLTNGYFRDTLSTLDEAYERPRYDGYLHFQDEAGPVVHRFLREGGDPRPILREMDDLYQRSLKAGQ
jgi:multiple sugar transport system substrate-binding protein